MFFRRRQGRASQQEEAGISDAESDSADFEVSMKPDAALAGVPTFSLTHIVLSHVECVLLNRRK